MNNYVERTNYLSKLNWFKEKNLIKVVTGIRRSGKSVLMEQFQEQLKREGVKEEQIISLNFEKLENEDLLDYKKMHDYITERLYKGGWTYLFLDEIQIVNDFQKAINSLRTKEKVDIYVTGSNSSLLSGELATLLTGRCITIHVLPLSFVEYLQAKKNDDFEKGKTATNQAPMPRGFLLKSYQNEGGKLTPQYNSYAGIYRQDFVDYVKLGSFPQTLQLSTQKNIFDYLDDVYSAIIRKDILARGKTVQEGILTSIAKFLFQNVGSETSSVNITNTLKSNKREVSYNTVEKYIDYLKDSFIVYEANLFDVKGKQILKKNAKYYAVDSGLRSMLLASKETDIGHVLENIVYLELLRREYKVSVGKIEVKKEDKTVIKEIDFVAEHEGGVEYFQVAASILDPNTLARELEPLNNVKDHFPKYIITLDDYTTNTTHNGIRVIHAIDFLLGNY